MKATFFGVKPHEADYLAQKIQEQHIAVEPTFVEGPLSEANITSAIDAEIISTFVSSPVSRDTIAALPALRCIATRSTGYDHIDLAAAAERNITVMNVPSYGENTVAEHAFGLLLAISKRIFDGYDQLRERGDFHSEALQGFDLKGKTLGVVGTGRIGCHSIAIGKGFGMNVIAYDPTPRPELEKTLGFTYVTFDELLVQSDVITLHVPLMETTRHLIDEKALSHMKPMAVLINTSRGGVVDTQALLKALQEKRIGGAGLDVLEEEGVLQDEMGFIFGNMPGEHDLRTVLADHELIDMPNVVMTPHSAYNTREALQRILDTTLQNIDSFVKGAPQNTVHA